MSDLTISTLDAVGVRGRLEVVAYLSDADGNEVSAVTADGAIVETHRTRTASDGTLTLDLTPNDDIPREGVYWTVKLGRHRFLVYKGPDAEGLLDALAMTQDDLGPAAASLANISDVDGPGTPGQVLSPKVDGRYGFVDAPAGAPIADQRILGNVAGVTAAPAALTPAEVRAVAELGDSATLDVGTAGGVATLDSNSTVPRGQLPAVADPIRVGGGYPGATWSGSLVRIDFSEFDDGDLADGIVPGLYDAAALASIGTAREDAMCVIDGLLGTTGRVGPDYPDGSFDGTTSGGRYLSYMDCGIGENFVAWTIGEAFSTGLAAPATNIVLDHAYQGIGMYWNAGLSWWELGVIGLDPYGFLYMDTAFADPPSFDADSCMAIRVCRGYVSGWFGSSTDGVPGTLTRVVGPAPIPSALRYSSLHGVQGDQSLTVPTGYTSHFGVDAFNGLAAPLEATPEVETSTAAAKSTGTSIVVTKPTGVAVGDLLVAVVASNAKAVTPPAGWTSGTSMTTGTVYLYQWYRVATSTDVSASNYTFSLASGDVAASMLRISGQNTRVPLIAGSQVNASAATAASTGATIAGVHRLGLWACAVPADTTIATPTGFTELTITPSGGTAITLKVATVDWVTVTGPYGSYGQQSGTVTTPSTVALGTSAASATCTVQVHPQPSAVTDA